MNIRHNALEQTVQPKPHRSSRHPRVVKLTTTKNVPTPKTATVTQLKIKPTPSWLLTLIFIQKSSGIISTGLVVITLAIYGLSVYTQSIWGQKYSKLRHLQKTERQLQGANAIILNHLASEAVKPESGLVHPNQATPIYLPPTPNRPPIIKTNLITSPPPSEQLSNRLGY